VLQAMAQFVLKIEFLSHIMGTTPILEMARAYGLHPRLWLLFLLNYYFQVSFQQQINNLGRMTATLPSCTFICGPRAKRKGCSPCVSRAGRK